MKVKLLAYTHNADKIVAQAAKLCYSPVGVEDIEKKLTEEEIERFVNHLVTIGHESPIEHVTFTFGIEGISRACSHQAVRHRIASFSQQSQRYVKLEQFEYIIPPQIEKNEKAKKIFIESMKQAQIAYDELFEILSVEKYKKAYDELIKCCGDNWDYIDEETKRRTINRMKKEIEKEVIEDCRYVFPNACETKMVITMNARSLLNLFNKRCCNRSQWEIRNVANEMLRQVKEVAPVLFKGAGPSCIRKKCPEGDMSCKTKWWSKEI